MPLNSVSTPSVHFDNADLASGDVLIHLGQDAFGCASRDEPFALLAECYAPHLIKGEPGRRNGWINRRLLGEVGGVGLPEVELAKGGAFSGRYYRAQFLP